MKTRVLVVDDSATVRELLIEIINADPGLEVVGTAANVFQARQQVKLLKPDVVTLDVEMPGNNGLVFLKNLMRLRPLPVLVLSSFTHSGSEVAQMARQLGAAAVMGKPRAEDLPLQAQEIRARIRAAAASGRAAAGALAHKVVAIGASTGGTEAIRSILEKMPRNGPPVLIVQHLPRDFVEPFARRLNDASAMRVSVARCGDVLESGRVYVAPGGLHHLVLSGRICQLEQGPRVSGHRPSVDKLFTSLAENIGENAIGVLLTGMGGDGVAGLGEVARRGGRTLVQDQASSAIWGMPGLAVKQGVAQSTLPLNRMAEAILGLSMPASDEANS